MLSGVGNVNFAWSFSVRNVLNVIKTTATSSHLSVLYLALHTDTIHRSRDM